MIYMVEGIIEFSEWSKIDLRVGKILSVEDIDGADKLYKLDVDIGDDSPRTLVAGIKSYYEKTELQDKYCVIFTNLKPRTMKGIESHGMLLAAVNDDESKVVLIQPSKEMPLGSKVR